MRLSVRPVRHVCRTEPSSVGMGICPGLRPCFHVSLLQPCGLPLAAEAVRKALCCCRCAESIGVKVMLHRECRPYSETLHKAIGSSFTWYRIGVLGNSMGGLDPADLVPIRYEQIVKICLLYI